MSLEKIRFLTTGGTIDKIYFDAKSDYQVGEPNIALVLKDMNVGFSYTVEKVLKKDSLEITPADRQKLADALAGHPSKRIVITHGTDTMVETAAFLAHSEASDGRTIVLTGALAPAVFKNTDAIFNIGCAIGAVQSLQPGIYIAMNGTVLNFDNARKNVAENRFEPLRQECN